MAITAATRTQLIGLSVAMLGQAPGTDRLNHWVADIDDDAMSVEDLANHIAESEAFQSEYPAFLTSMEFAEAFLGNVLPGLDEASMTEAVDIVSGMLDSGTSRGALALAVVDFLHDVADKGMEHDSYESFGMSAMTMANKIEVASHYTLNARMMDPSSDVLANVTDDADSAAMAIDAIDNPPAPPEMPEMGQEFMLEAGLDTVSGTNQDDLIIAQPVIEFGSRYVQPLQPFDRIDGGEGEDTLLIYDVGGRPPGEDDNFRISNAQVTNVEKVIVNAQGGVIADMSEWEGLESVELASFARNGSVSITVNGAMVSTDRTYGGATATLNGAAGAVELSAGGGTAVSIGSGAHTTSVSVMGGGNVNVHNGLGKPSGTVTSVSVDGVAADATPGVDDDARVDGVQDGVDLSKPTTTIRSNVIEMVSLANTFGTVLIENASDEAEDLMLTVDSYGGQRVNLATGAPSTSSADTQWGKLCLIGDGSAESVMIDVMGDSRFRLASNEVKAISVSGDSKLTLDVNMFNAVSFDIGASATLETITVSGGAGLTAALNDGDTESSYSKLQSIDASDSSGANRFTSSVDLASLKTVTTGSGKDTVSLVTKVNGKLESVSTGDGDDSVTIGGSAVRSAGIAVDLGAGNDRYKSGIDNSVSRVDAGEGRDTLNLTNGTGATYKDSEGKTHSIYSGFEVLDVGGATGAKEYDLELLGIEAVEVRGDADAVLNNVAGGTPVSISGITGAGRAATPDTNAVVTLEYNLADDATRAGTLIGGSNASILNVSLTAAGGSLDTKRMTGGESELTFSTVDPSIRAMIIDSDAILNARPSRNVSVNDRPGEGHYQNKAVLGVNSIREVKITGDSMLHFSGTTGSLELVDATENKAGVIAMGGSSDGVTMYGSAAKDEFTGAAGADDLFGNGGGDVLNGGDGNDKLTGGAGADTMTGGNGNDEFRIGSSDSNLIFHPVYGAIGFDTIKDFGTGTDKILLSSSLYYSFQGGVKGATDFDDTDPEFTGAAAVSAGIIDSITDEGTVAETMGAGTIGAAQGGDALRAFVAREADRFFETVAVVQQGENQFSGQVTKHSVAVINEQYTFITQAGVDSDNDGEFDTLPISEQWTRTWVFIDVDGDGDFDTGTDMVILLNPDDSSPVDIGTDAFGAIT